MAAILFDSKWKYYGNYLVDEMWDGEYNIGKKEGVDMTVAEMKRKKQELGYTNEMIAELSGVPLGTVQKIFAGVTDSPRYDTLQALEKAFRDNLPDMLKEPVLGYQSKRQREYTLRDYYELPEECRVELIDGKFYDMAAPSTIHQALSLAIGQKISGYIMGKKGKCVPFTAPVDVQLDCDDRTMVQPDVLVVCDRSKIIRRCVYGAPDFIIEILSASTRKKDMTLKLTKYAEAGVCEYWLVDPDKRKIIVYDLENEEIPAIYGFDAKVPVGIFDGECEIDFAEIYEYISFLYEE